MATLYTIRNWSEKYENSGSRKIKGPLDWFSCPTKHDGLSYRRLMRRADGMEMYGAWVLIAAVGAKCKPRGTLQSDDGPLTAEDIAMKTGAPEECIKRALQLFSSKEVPWLTGSTSGDDGSVLPDHPDEVVLQVGQLEQVVNDNKTAPAPQAEPEAVVEVVSTSARKLPTYFTADDFTYPPPLDTPECRASIETWLKHKREKRQSYKSTTALNLKLDDFARDGPDALVAAVRFSIGNNYDGLFPDKNFKHANRNSPAARKPDPGLEYIEPNGSR